MEETNTHSQKRQRTEIKTRSTTLTDLDVLDCPVCFEPLTIPTFQCDNGHLVCSVCFAKVNNKCPGPACKLRIGKKRCISMGKVLGSVLVRCQNAEFGCLKSFNYGNQINLSSHEKECKYFKCSCPKLDCRFTGSSKNIYSHFVDSHLEDSKTLFFSLSSYLDDVDININEKNLVLWEDKKKLLFVIQCFTEEQGVYVTLRRISSSIPDAKEYKYGLLYRVDGHTFTYESPKVKSVLETSSARPDQSFLFIPNSFLRGEMLKLKFCIADSPFYFISL